MRKRILSFVLVLAMLMTLMPTVFAAQNPAAAGLGMKWTGTECHEYDDPDYGLQQWKQADLGLKFDISVKSGAGSTIGGGNTVTIGYDSTVVYPANKRNGGAAGTSGDAVFSASETGTTHGWALTDFSGPKTLDENRGYFYATFKPAAKQTYEDYTTIGSFYFALKEGKTLADLNKNSIWLLNTEDDLNAAQRPLSFSLSTGTENYRYFVIDTDTKTRDESQEGLIESQFTNDYPRKDADKPIEPSAGDPADERITINEDGSVTLPAPELGKVYGTETPDNVQLSIAGATTQEGAAFVTDTPVWTDGAATDPLSFNIAADGTITSTKAVGKDFAAVDNGKITIKATIDSTDYTKDITVKIPAVVLPKAELAETSGSALSDSTKTIADVMDTVVLKNNTGWSVLDTDFTDEVNSSETYTAFDTTQALNKGTYEIPLFKARDDASENPTRATVQVYTLTVVDAPKTEDVAPLVADGAYTSEKTSLYFEQATNPGWEYSITADAPAIRAAGEDAAEVGVWKAGVAHVDADPDNGVEEVAGGVTFGNLTPGTSYKLHVRAAADPENVVDAATDAVTLYDLNVQSAVYKNSTENPKPSTLTKEGEAYFATAQSDGPVNTQAAIDAVVQEVVVASKNTNPLYGITAQVYKTNPGPDGALEAANYSEKYTATATATEPVNMGESFKVDVTPISGQMTRGKNTEYLVITAYDSAAKTTELVRVVITVDCVVYDKREGAVTGTDAQVLKPANLKAESDAKATANKEIPLDVKIGEIAADSYELTFKKQDAENNDLVELSADGKKLVLKSDISDLGKIATVTAKFDKKGVVDEQELYYLAEEKTVDVYVKAGVDDELTTGETTEQAYQKYYEEIVRISGDEAKTIDFAKDIGAIISAGEETPEVTVAATKALPSGAELTGTKLTIPAGYTHYTEGTYTVTIPATENYEAGTATVTIKVLKERKAADPTPLKLAAGADDVVIGETTVEHANAKVITLPKPQVDGAAYTGDVTYAFKADTTELGTIDNTAGTLTLPASVTDSGKVEITMTVPKDVATDGSYGTEATATYTINILKAPTFTVTGKTDYEKTDADSAVALTVTRDDGTAITNGTYSLKSGAGILDVTASSIKIPAAPSVYGKAVVTISVPEDAENGYLAGSQDVEIFVRQPADEAGGDPEIGDPYNGTGATILGREGNSGDFTITFNKDTDADGVNDYWDATVEGAGFTQINGVQFSGLTVGVSYQVRFLFEGEETWFGLTNKGEPATQGVADDGWWSFDALSGAHDDGTYGAKSDTFTWVATEGKLVAAQIRYTPDGTVGDTTVDPAGGDNEAPYEFTVHNLKPGVLYEYEVVYTEAHDGKASSGWLPVPADGRVAQEAPADTTLEQYSGTSEYAFTKVNTRFTENPVITEEDEYYVIDQLKPGYNYDISNAKKDDGTDNAFTEDNETAGTTKNYATRPANADGKIYIWKVETTEQPGMTVENYDIFTAYGDAPYLVRMSGGAGNTPGEPEVIDTGVTVKGQVQSFTRCVETNVYLYAFNADGTAPTYRDGRVLRDTPYKCKIAAYKPTDTGAHNTSLATQDFAIENVPAGKYTLVAEKKGCTFYVVEGLEVGTTELDLTKSDNSKVSKMLLVQGDLDGNGTVTVDDFNEAYLEQNWGKNDTEAAKPECDLDGNGVITVDDFNTAYLEQNWMQGDVVVSLTTP